MLQFWNGSNWEPAPGDAIKGLAVNVTTEAPLAVLESTTTPLAISAAFTGASVAVGAYKNLVGTVYSDQAGNVYIDQSPDGTNWDFSTTIALTAATGVNINVPRVAPYARLRVVNNATAETVLRAYLCGSPL